MNPPATSTLLAPGQFERIAKALADPRRFAMLETISSALECPNQALCNDFPVSKATISHHIKELVQAGLIEPEREGRAASIDGGLVGGRRFERDQRLGRLQHPVLVGATEIAEVYNRGHDPDKDTEGTEDTEKA